GSSGAILGRRRDMVKTIVAIAWLLGPAALLAQDYEGEVRTLAEESGVDLHFEESDNFVWATAPGKSQMRPIVQAAEKAFAHFKQVAELESWKDIWGPARGGAQKALMIVTANRLQHQKVIAWYQKKYDPFDGFKEV